MVLDFKVNKTWQSEEQSYNGMNQEQAVHHTTLISGYHVSAAKNHVSSEKPRKFHCICFHSSSMLHNTLEWKSNVNFKCSSKLQFQGYYFHTNDVANITLAEQKNKRYWRVHNNVGSHLRRKLCAAKPTILSERHRVLSICLSGFSNTQSILLTSNFTPLCETLVNFFDSYNLILSEYYLLTSPWFVVRMLLNELWSTCLYSHSGKAWMGMPINWPWMVILDHDVYYFYLTFLSKW